MQLGKLIWQGPKEHRTKTDLRRWWRNKTGNRLQLVDAIETIRLVVPGAVELSEVNCFLMPNNLVVMLWPKQTKPQANIYCNVEPRKQIALHLPPSLWERLKAEAKQHKITLHEYSLLMLCGKL